MLKLPLFFAPHLPNLASEASSAATPAIPLTSIHSLTGAPRRSAGPAAAPAAVRRSALQAALLRQHAQAQANAAPAPPPMRARVVADPDKKLGMMQRIRRRPLVLGSKLLGLGGSASKDRPQVLGLPSADALREEAAQDLIDKAGELAHRVDAMLETSLDELADVNQRPGRSNAMEKLTSVWPLSVLKPVKVRDLVDQDPAYAVPGQGRRAAAAAAPADTREPRRAWLTEMANGMAALTAAEDGFAEARTAFAASATPYRAARTRLDAAAEALRQVRAGIAADRAATPGASVDLAALADAHGELDAAREALAGLRAQRETQRGALAGARAVLEGAVRSVHAGATLNAKLGASENALATDLLHRKTDFVKVQIEQYSAQLRQSGLKAKERERLLKARRESMQHAVGLDVMNASQAAIALAAMTGERRAVQGHIDDAGEQLAQLEAGPFYPGIHARLHELNEELRYNNTQLRQLDAALPAAQRAVTQAEDDVATARLALEQFLPGFAQEMDAIGDEQAGLEAALDGLAKSGEPLALRAEQWQLRAEETRALETSQHEQAIAALVATAPGFGVEEMAAAGAALKAGLQSIADALPPDDPKAERALPRLAALEIISRAVAGVCGGDAQQAAALLRELMAHSSEHWLPVPGGARPGLSHAAPSEPMRLLFQRMAVVPRGTELLNLVGARDGRPAMDGAQLEALQAYWTADLTQTAGVAPEVHAWLESAKSVACHAVRNRKGEAPLCDTAALPLAHSIAFRAVTKGFLSNAAGSEFDRVNTSLLKVGGQWVDAAQDERGKLLKWLPRSPLNPASIRTPFDPKALKLAIRQLEAQGLPSIKSSAHDGVAGIARALGAKVALAGISTQPARADDADAMLFDLTAKVVCDYIAGQKNDKAAFGQMASPMRGTDFHRAKRLYKAELDKHDFDQIRREVLAQIDAAGEGGGARQPRRLSKHGAQSLVLPEPFQSMFAQRRLAPVDALRRIGQQLEAAMPDAGAAAAPLEREVGLDTIDRKIEIARRKRFTSKSDINDFYQPVLESLRLRTQLNIASGGEVGIGIPILPWAPIAPLLANLNVNIFSRKQEAAFQLKAPTYGVEFIFADTTTHASDAKGTVGFGLDLGLFKVMLPAISAKFERSSAKTDFTVLRTLRKKDGSGGPDGRNLRDDAIKLLDTVVRWDADDQHPAAGQQFGGPLEAVLALHPDILIGAGSKDIQSRQLGIDLAVVARTPFGGEHVAGGIGVTPLAVKAEVTKEVSEERSGYAHQGVRESSDQRKQRAAAGATLGALATFFKTPANPDSADGKVDKAGAWRAAGMLNIVDVSRDLAFNLEKNGAARFAMGDKTGGSVERLYGSPKDVLAEIEANMEDFYLRFLATVSVASGAERDTPENRALAERTLRQFRRDLVAAKGHPNLQFSLKYEMQRRMSGWVDALNALEVIALQNNEPDAALASRAARNELVSFRSSWSFKNCVIQSKGKESSDLGWDFVVRLMAQRSAETSIGFTAFPR